MKRFGNVLFAIAAITLTFCFSIVPTQAASFTTQADALNKMGLFLGTEKGYELNRPPTRAEAAVMLVRLLGKEAEVKAGTYSHPFKDVPLWLNKYVGYLYTSGLTKGTSLNTFSPSVNCSLEMYTVFSLRTLGYTEENGSFTYDQAVSFAESIGLLDPSARVSFLRDDMVAISYSSLFQHEKDKSYTKLEALISNKSVDQTAAQKYLDSFQVYRSYVSTSVASYIDISSFIRDTLTSNVSIDGQTQNYEYQSDNKTVVNGNDITMYNLEMVQDDYYEEYESYYSNGWLYTQPNNKIDWVKEQAQLDINDYIATTKQVTLPYYLLNNITKATSGNDTIYTVNYSAKALNAILASELSSFEDVIDQGSIQIETLQEVSTFGPDGKIKSNRVTNTMSAKVTDGETVYPLSIDMVANMSVLETGSSVTIDLPTALNGAKIGSGSVDPNQPPMVLDPTYHFYETLDFKPYDVKFDEANGFIYMIDKSSKSLLKYSVKDKIMTKRQFSYIPERLHLDNGKVYVTLATGDHSFSSKPIGYIGVVDANTLKVIKILDIKMDPYDVAAKDGYIYVTSGSGQWDYMKSFDEETGIELASTFLRQASTLELHPFGDKVYTITTDLIPRDMSTFMISQGKIEGSYDSMYHGDYPMDKKFTLSPDGKYIYNNSGYVFRCGYGQDNDIMYYRQFSKPFNSVAFDLQNDRLYMSAGDSGTINYYNYTTLEWLGTLRTQTKADFMTVMDGKLVTMENQGGSNGINVLKIN